ncbi:MAG: radical SAM protein [Verrucomicrobia bacterium]|nr:radical SAM protein [Verrucomicrobiota bacterium]
MKILLANPPARIPLEGTKERFFVRAGSRWPFSFVKDCAEAPWYAPFPFYLAYTAAILHDDGHDVYVIDAVPLNYTVEEFLNEVVEVKPDIVLFESATPTFNLDIQLIRQLKSRLPQVVLCMSGPHVTVFPRETLQHAEIDCVFLREYELSFSEFVQVWSRSPVRDQQTLGNISGIAFLDKGTGEYVSRPPVAIENLDALPFPKRDIFPSNKIHGMRYYWTVNNPQPAIQMHASRGCPFRCSFCLWTQVMYEQGKYRMFSPKRIVDEMEAVKNEYQIKEVYFDDDTFTGNRKHVLEFCAELKKRNLGLTWSAMGDLIIANEQMLQAMAEAGCTLLKFGVESGDPGVLQHLGKPVNLTEIKRKVALCVKFGIQTHATFTYGLTGDTEATIRRTLQYAKELDSDSVQFSITTPFPGTQFYEEVKKGGLLESEAWERFDGGRTSPILIPTLDRRWLERFLHRSLQRWLFAKIRRPHWVLRQIKYFRRTEKQYGTHILWRKFLHALTILRLR